ncbi:hypothetical protein CEXT_367971 [Caerostris extrusa]|uniref:Integrase zinc-binding domain-containing protein n=1 Tax=Caerostris extrusa TaxID=172846 RepID=A0AAV4Y0A9_CAEEX|nr:hypothetical protein CEXT_367971 [Caerostris extrusa]
MVSTVLQFCHDNNSVAHPGLTRTLKRIEQNYFWQGLYLNVKNYIASCHSCIQRRGFSKTVKAPIQKIPIAEYPFQKCAFDAIQHINKPINKQRVHLNRLVKVAVREIFPDIGLDEQTVNLSNSQKIDVTRENIDNEVLNQFPPFCRPYQNWGYPEEVLVRKDHSSGVGEPPPQAVDDHSPLTLRPHK